MACMFHLRLLVESNNNVKTLLLNVRMNDGWALLATSDASNVLVCDIDPRKGLE